MKKNYSNPYSVLYKDPRWQKKRLDILQRDKFTCTRCGDTDSTLNVHHDYYEKGRGPWDYPNYSLRTLCECCHKEVELEREKAHKGESMQTGVEHSLDMLLLGRHQDSVDIWEIGALIYYAASQGNASDEIYQTIRNSLVQTFGHFERQRVFSKEKNAK